MSHLNAAQDFNQRAATFDALGLRAPAAYNRAQAHSHELAARQAELGERMQRFGGNQAAQSSRNRKHRGRISAFHHRSTLPSVLRFQGRPRIFKKDSPAYPSISGGTVWTQTFWLRSTRKILPAWCRLTWITVMRSILPKSPAKRNDAGQYRAIATGDHLHAAQRQRWKRRAYMTLSEAFALTSFTLFSISDLRTRLVPGIEWFFAGAILLTLPASPIQTGLVVLAAGWGLFRNRSGLLALPLLFYPPTWPVLLTGYGHRRGWLGERISWRSPGWRVCYPFRLCSSPCLAWKPGAGCGCGASPAPSRPCLGCFWACWPT
jgi:hypothetical protein